MSQQFVFFESRATEYSKMIQSLYDFVPAPYFNKSDMYKDIVDESTSGTESEYELDFIPYSNSLQVFINGVYQSQYILTGNTIDFGEIVPEGYRIIAWYVKEES